MRAAIDFGISNTDLVVEQDGDIRHWAQASRGKPTPELLDQLFAHVGLRTSDFKRIAVTGGQHNVLPRYIGSTEIVPIGELTAIGRGGQALAQEAGIAFGTPLVVVSAGSGTAAVAARDTSYNHITGSGVGGGTLLGLGRLLLQTVDPREIDALACKGDPNGADLALADVISGPIGSLPADATAVNFGRLGREAIDVSREDLAASLVTLVSQVIAVTAINAARAQQIEHVVVIGHLTDMASVCKVLKTVGGYYGMDLIVPGHAGHSTALGALLHLPPA
jgi:Pantothenate kinase, acetyl-CoA regulated